jgi:hypothetical protein
MIGRILFLVVVLSSLSNSFALTHGQAQSMLSAAGISVRSSCGCSDRNRKCCTSLTDVRQGTIIGIIGFKGVSGCPVTITGGTEVGHAGGQFSHRNGYKVDIALNACVNGHITRRFKFVGNRGDGAPMYRGGPGNGLYAKEGNHWDILYN